MIGSRLGAYEITAKLGEGGMGEVYRATDSRLKREVAIKVLPARFAGNAEMRQRFEREARAAAALSHPRICAIHDVGSHEGTEFLVMELLDGESLAERLSRGPLPLDQVIRIGQEICAALDAAHGAGMVHRDLKPANVMLTKSGTKLLDFGLAKLRERLETPASSQVDTLKGEETLTEPGAILGTICYMAPEQLLGLAADSRVDVFALGCVLYEMATGQRAFPGPTKASVIAAILSADPPVVSSLSPGCPAALDRLVRVCLAREPETRWQSAHDVGLQLGAIQEGPAAAPRAAAAGPKPVPFLPWAVAALALLAAAALVFPALRGRSVPRGETVVRFSVPPPAETVFPGSFEGRAFAVSPDGRALAFIAAGSDGTTRVFLRPLASLESRPLAGTEGVNSIFWSPDSRSVGFFVGGKLKRLDPASGEAAVPVCDVRDATHAGSWGAGGQIVFSTMQGETIYAASTDGGSARPILRADPTKKETSFAWPTFLADGVRFTYLVHRADTSKVLMLFDPGRPPREIGPIASDAQLLESGFLLFVREGTLLAQRFDPDTARLSGEPVLVAPNVDYFLSTGSAGFSASRDGTIAYHFGESRDRFLWLDRQGRPGPSVESPGRNMRLAISPDGSRLLFDRTRPGVGTWDVWILDLARGGEERVTAAPDTEIAGAWTPDGRGIFYSANRGRSPQLVRRDLETGRDEDVTPQSGFQQAQAVSPDGRTLAFLERSPTRSGRFEAWTVTLDGTGRRSALLPSTFRQSEIRFSPDGRFMALISDETGRPEVYVTPFPPSGRKVRVSSDGASLMRWSRTSSEILYVSADRKMVAVPVKTAPSIQIGKPTTLFELQGTRRWTGFDVTADGQRFLAIVPEVSGLEAPLSIVTGWSPTAASNGETPAKGGR
jgi:Tol biopolymer transport system component